MVKTISANTDEVLAGIIEEGAKAAEAPPSDETSDAAPSEVSEGAPVPGGERYLEEIASYSGEQINSQVIFAEEGLTRKERRKASPVYKRKLAEVARYYKRVKAGHVSMQQLQESMMSSEFTALLGDTLDRIVLAQWSQYDPTYRAFMRRRTVRDFRSVHSIRLVGGERLTQVAEGTNYPQDAVSESSYSFAVKKYGKTFELTWEMIVNDDLDAFTSLPDRMARAAIQTEMYVASSLYVNNTTLFATNHSHNGNTYSNKLTLPLTIANIETAYNQMVAFPGDNDIPLNNMPMFLVIPPQLFIKARRELNDLAPSVGDISAPEFPVLVGITNVLGDAGMNIVIDPYIPVIDSTNGATSWYLFSDPAEIPAVEYGYLRGYEEPQVFMRNPNAVRMGAGTAEVDFDNDSRGYKVRHVYGGSHTSAVGGWRGCIWSDGSGA